MTKGLWQIYNHGDLSRKFESGDSETLPLSKVPQHVLNAAVKVSHHVGKALYGVDLKKKNGKAYVIEINDNPNIDSNSEAD